MRFLALVVVVACSGTPSPPRVPPPTPIAVVDPPTPGFRLPQHFVPTEYTATLSLEPTQIDFTGRIAIAGTLAAPTHVIWLHAKDLAIREAIATRDEATIALTVTPDGDRLQLRAVEPLRAGAWTIRIAYSGKLVTDDAKAAFRKSYGDDLYILTQLGADHARRVFPCFDEPGFKVPWQLSLEVRDDLVAVSNTPSIEHITHDGIARITFAKTKPLPTYLIAFAVGPFAVIDAGKSKAGTPVRIVTPRGTEPRAKYVAGATPKLIDLLEDWFGMPFPYPKLDVIVAPSFGDAMENAGAILSDPAYALVEAVNPSWASRHEVVMTIGHEVAHQWFGDLVTHAWWDDLWLTEAFATWMENYITAWFDKGWHDEDQFVSVRNGALAADGLTTARRIREPVVDASGIVNSYDVITYQKGASLLRMIEQQVGPAAFQQGVRAYLREHAHGSATAGQLIDAIGKAANQPLKPVFDSFLDQPGVPEVTLAIACDGKPRIEVSQQRTVPVGAKAAGDPRWTMPVCVVHDADGKRATSCAVIDQKTGTIPVAQCPTWIMGNVNGSGYYNVAVTTKDVTALHDRAWPHLTTRERRVVLEDARRRVLDGKVEFGALMSIWQKLATSDDPLSVGDALGGTGRASALLAMRGLPSGIDMLLPTTSAAAVRAKVRAVVAPRVATLGLLPRADDDFARELLREANVQTVSRMGDPVFTREVVKLAPRYRTLPIGLRMIVLRLAVNADRTFGEQIYAAVMAESDSVLRHEMLWALANVSDPARLSKYLALALHDKVDLVDQAYLFAPVGDASRAATESWLRTHWAELARKLPADGGIGMFLGGLFVDACDATRRDDTVVWLRKLTAGRTGGELVAKQNIESLDQCIARRAQLAPSVTSWVSGARR